MNGTAGGPRFEAGHSTGWVVLGYDDVLLAVSQEQVRAIAETLGFAADPQRRERWNDPRRQWPAFRLDGRLQPQAGERRRFAVFVESVPHPLGLLVDSVQILAPNAVQPHLLPPIFGAVRHSASHILQLDQERIATVIDPVMLFMDWEDALKGVAA
jgi:hypothetical protein